MCVWDFKVTRLDIWFVISYTKFASNFNLLLYSSDNSTDTNLGVALYLYRTHSYGV